MVQSARKNVTGAGICTFFLFSAALPPRLAVVFDGRRATLLSGRENPDPSVDVTVHLTAARGRRSVPRRERVPCACGRRHGRLRISCLVPEGRVGAAGGTSGGQPRGGGEEGGRDPHERPRRGLRDACSRSRGTGALTCSSGTTLPSARRLQLLDRRAALCSGRSLRKLRQGSPLQRVNATRSRQAAPRCAAASLWSQRCVCQGRMTGFLGSGWPPADTSWCHRRG